MGVLIWCCAYIEKGESLRALFGQLLFFLLCKQKLFCVTPDFNQTTVCDDWIMVYPSFTVLLL